MGLFKRRTNTKTLPNGQVIQVPTFGQKISNNANYKVTNDGSVKERTFLGKILNHYSPAGFGMNIGESAGKTTNEQIYLNDVLRGATPNGPINQVQQPEIPVDYGVVDTSQYTMPQDGGIGGNSSYSDYPSAYAPQEDSHLTNMFGPDVKSIDDLYAKRQSLARAAEAVASGIPMGDDQLAKMMTGLSKSALSPDQWNQVQRASKDYFNGPLSHIDTYLQQYEKAQASSASNSGNEYDLTPKQSTLFNQLVNQQNKSPLIAAADRSIILKSAIDNVKKDPTNAAQQMNLSYAYIAALDTYQSAVREGELSNLGSIDSTIGKYTGYIQKLQKGQVIRPEIALQIAEAANTILDTIHSGAQAKANSFRSQAHVLGIGDAYDAYTGGYTSSYDNTQSQNQQSSQPTYGTANGVEYYMGQDGKLYPKASGAGGSPVSINIPSSSKIAYVNNNPGNLRFVGQPNATAGYKGFAKFATPQAGYQALVRQIGINAKQGHTLASFISRYAPPSENDTNTYIAQAIKAVGVPPNTPISKIDIHKLAKFMALKESSTQVA